MKWRKCPRLGTTRLPSMAGTTLCQEPAVGFTYRVPCWENGPGLLLFCGGLCWGVCSWHWDNRGLPWPSLLLTEPGAAVHRSEMPEMGRERESYWFSCGLLAVLQNSLSLLIAEASSLERIEHVVCFVH